MSGVFFKSEDILKGISLVLNDFSDNKVDLELLAFKKTDVPDFFYNIKFNLTYNSVVYNIDTLIIFPDNENIYYFKNKEYYSPYVLFEKKERIQKQLKKDFVNSMDLNDFWIIPGYFLQRAMMMMHFMKSIDSIKTEIDEDKKLVLQDLLSANLSRVIAGASSSFPWYDSGKSRTIIKDDEEKKIKKFRYITPPGIFPLSSDNKLLKYSNLRKVVYHSEFSESMRSQHKSQIGKIDLLETPESEKIGLSLYMTKNAKYIPDKLEILAKEEYDCSYSTFCVPYKSYSDSTRTMMGGKNLKQAIKVKDSELPKVITGIEKEIGFYPGVNAFVGYALYKGLNFEDGIVVSDSFSNRMEIESVVEIVFEDSIPLPDYYSIKYKKNGFTVYDTESFNIKKRTYNDGAIKIDYIFSKKSLYYKDVLLKRNVKKYDLNSKTWKQLTNKDVHEWSEKAKELKSRKSMASKAFLYKERYSGEISNCPEDINIVVKKPFKKKECFQLSDVQINFKIRIRKPLEKGDKITGRHGNKGTVSSVVPQEKMPYIINNGRKEHLEMILNPLGIITRMNLGQLLETQGSMVDIFECKGFNNFNYSELLHNYEDCQISKPENENLGRVYLYSEDGEKFPATVGYQYFIRLNHCVRDKLHVIGKTNRISMFSSQPLKGKKNDGGQRCGEMEFWSLFDYNALNIIDRFSKTNLRKWDNSDYKKTYNSILNLKGIDANYDKFPEVKIKKPIFEKNEIKQIWSYYKPFLYERVIFSKDGFFRKNMLGRRLNYSGRATISPAVDIDMNHVKLPIEFAFIWNDELKLDFLKDINNHLIYSENLQESNENRKKLSEKINSEIRKRDKNIFVLLNRQPSLHLHSIQSFIPIFSPDYSIGLPIMVCEGFGADFDGDTMAVYYPVDQEKEEFFEELESMLPSHNPFKIGNGDLIFSTGQDITYGHYILNNKKENKKGTQESLKKLIIQNTPESLPKKALEWQNERLEAATKKGLSLSIFEIKDDTGYLKDIKESGARGKDENFTQLQKSISFGSDNEIKESFSNGISIKNYFGSEENFQRNIALRGRKSLMDKKLHVAQAGYLTRKLVEFLYAKRITEEDCGAEDGIFFDNKAVNTLDKNKYSLEKIVNGRYYKFEKDSEWKLCENPEDLRNRDFWLRSPVKCKSKEGFCSKCCGKKLSCSKDYKIGEFIGVISGHSIGERGTQLSMKTFQTGASGFNMQKVSKIFFQRTEKKKEILDFVEYLINLSYTDIKELMSSGERYLIQGKTKITPENPLLDTIEISSIYFEILFSALVKRKVYSESEAIKYLMDFEKNGFFSSISFQSNKKGMENLLNELKPNKTEEKQKAEESKQNNNGNDDTEQIKEKIFFEKSPKSIYSLRPGEVIKYGKKDE